MQTLQKASYHRAADPKGFLVETLPEAEGKELLLSLEEYLLS